MGAMTIRNSEEIIGGRGAMSHHESMEDLIGLGNKYGVSGNRQRGVSHKEDLGKVWEKSRKVGK